MLSIDACYHITSRGSRKDKIFYTDEDKSYFLELLNQTCNKYSITCYAYCLMDNHYHLFINTQKPNISQAMHFLNTSYTNWFKAKHNIVESILQEIGKIYDLDYSAVSQSCKRFERIIKEDRKLGRKVKQIENKLTI